MFLSSARFFSEYHNLLIGAGIRTYTHYYVSGNLQRNLAPATYQVPSTLQGIRTQPLILQTT